MNTSLVLLFLYALLLIGLGLAIGRIVRTTSDFFVAGRRLGTLPLFATLLAANIGAGSTVGAAGLGFRDGLSAWWWVGSAGLGSIVLGLWVGPRIWKVASSLDLRTVGDYLEHRYGQSVRGVVAALLWLATPAILAGQLVALATVLNVVGGVDPVVGCLVGGLVMTVYFAAGGLLTSAWVNLVQLAVLLIGFALAVPFALSAVGGWQGLVTQLPDTNALSFWRNGSSGWIYLAFLGPSFIISPGLLQKIYGARGLKTVRLAVTLQGLALLSFAAIPPLLGMCTRVLHPNLENPRLAIATLLSSDVPVVIGTLGLAAIVSAEISSADAILFMLSTSLSQDLYRRFVNPQASDARVLRVARLAAVFGELLGVVLAIVLGSIIQSLTIFYSLLVISLFVPLIAGLYSRRGGVPEALTSIAAGMAVMGAVSLATGGAGFGLLTPQVLGVAAAGAGFFGVLVVRKYRRGR